MDYNEWTDAALKGYVAGCKQGMEAAQAELLRREEAAKRKPLYMKLSGPDCAGDYGFSGASPAAPVMIDAAYCKLLNLDPAEVARAASICLCMADWLNRANVAPGFAAIEVGTPLHNEFCWLVGKLKHSSDIRRWSDAARAAGWIA